MNKTNVFRSSDFFMAIGDTLHMIIMDESGVQVDPFLVGEGNVESVPGTPVAVAASDVEDTSFTANWQRMENTTGYRLDVSRSSTFDTFVGVYNKLDMGSSIEKVVSGLVGLATYYYRVWAYNDNGESALPSNVITTTTEMEFIIDIDGNEYNYITVGTQQWLIENLKTTKYADGVVIPNLTLAASWIAEDGTAGKDGAYCWYNNDEATYKADYGALYNWYAVNNAHGLAMEGWSIATKADYDILIAAVGGNAVGGKLKEEGIDHWINPNVGAEGLFGFNALPGGNRNFSTGAFAQITGECNLWTSTSYNAANAWRINMFWSTILLQETYNQKQYGFSVRCVRNV